MKERIKEIRKANKMTQNQFAEKLRVAPNYVYMVETGKTPVSDKLIFSICNIFKVNETWLRTGNGEMYEPMSVEQEIAHITATLVKENNETLIKLVKVVTELDSKNIEMLKELAEKWIAELKENDPTN